MVPAVFDVTLSVAKVCLFKCFFNLCSRVAFGHLTYCLAYTLLQTLQRNGFSLVCDRK